MRITRTLNKFVLSCILMALSICSMPAFAADTEEHPRKIMLASTIGPIDAGVVGALEAAFTKKSGVTAALQLNIPEQEPDRL